MLHRQFIDTFRKEVSGKRIMEYVHKIWVHDRLSTFSAFHDAAKVAKSIMEDANLDDVTMYQYESKGLFEDILAPQGWDADSGVLDITGADGSVKRIADREADPCHLFIWCGNTPEEGVETEIVRWEDGKDIEGKLVYSENHTSDPDLKKKLIAGKALGIVSDFIPTWPEARVREENMNIVRWDNAFFYPGNPENLLGFSITPASGDWLRKNLDENGGSLKAFTRSDTKLYDGILDVTTGCIRGSEEPDKEIWFIQHLHEVGAHDNTSGSASVIEMLRAMKKLIDSGKIKRPRRTIRIIFAWEIYGYMAHFTANPELKNKIIYGLNPDMIGADWDKCRSWLQVFDNPHSNPSFTDELIYDLVGETFSSHPRWKYERQPYMVNDNFIADPFTGVPCPALVCLRDRFYHSSSDTPDKLDPEVMSEITSMMASYAHTLANGGSRSAEDIGKLVYRAALKNIAENVADCESAEKLGENVCYARDLWLNRIESLNGLAVGDNEKNSIAKLVAELSGKVNNFATRVAADSVEFKLEPSTELEKKAASIVPKRKIQGPLSLNRVPMDVKKARGIEEVNFWNFDENTPIFWADGQRNVFEINWLTKQELGKEPGLEKLINLFETMAEYDY